MIQANSGRAQFPRIDVAARQRWLPALLLVASNFAHAVAGGGGGGGGSSGGGNGDGADFIFQILIWIIFDLPFPYNLIALALLGALAWYATRQVKSVSGLNRIPSIGQLATKSFAIPADFFKRNPGFAPETLLAKANTAFMAIQQAWMKQDMAPVRRWISDGVWQRFTTQITMMRLLGQQNVVGNIQIRKVFIDAIEQDGNFDIVHIGIHFTANDDFVSAKFPQLDQRGSLEMLEYWTFIRKSGVAENDLYHSNRCPSCGAELPGDLGEVVRCASCQAVSTLGDYDWILSEITQADDYANENTKLKKTGSFTQRIRDAVATDGDFSVQLIEDKASNAYLQIMTAQATRRPEAMRRFVGDELFARLSREFAEQAPFVFNRLYLNNVTAIDFYRAEGKDNLVVAIKRTAQRVAISEGRLKLIDQGLYTRNEIMILSRDVGAGVPKGSLYAHACPACGGPLGDTLELKCGYCGEILNSTRNEWIVSSLLLTEEYKALTDSQKPPLTTGVSATQLDPVYAARDLAFNNLLMILGIDGEITPDEMTFAEELSRQMGYNPQKLAGLFELAKNRQLSLRLPETRKSALRVRLLMEKGALADHNISPAEQALLNEVSQRIEKMSE
ncbi:TIM44-like domain-containing protein [Propionivibrio sp.]|uniref:TIM44-like domain-containing protein n=1 Tax=Propionivibrio sp. TaxID=2212460 RepID=UPI003BF1BE8B